MTTIRWVAQHDSSTDAKIGHFALNVRCLDGNDHYRVTLYEEIARATRRRFIKVLVDFHAANEVLAHRYAIEHFEDYLNDKMLPYSTALVAVKEYLEQV